MTAYHIFAYLVNTMCIKGSQKNDKIRSTLFLWSFVRIMKQSFYSFFKKSRVFISKNSSNLSILHQQSALLCFQISLHQEVLEIMLKTPRAKRATCRRQLIELSYMITPKRKLNTSWKRLLSSIFFHGGNLGWKIVSSESSSLDTFKSHVVTNQDNWA